MFKKLVCQWANYLSSRCYGSHIRRGVSSREEIERVWSGTSRGHANATQSVSTLQWLFSCWLHHHHCRCMSVLCHLPNFCVCAVCYVVTKFVIICRLYFVYACDSLLGAVTQLWRATVTFIKFVHLSVCLSTQNSPAPNGWIFMKLNVWVKGGEVVSPTHRPPLPLGDVAGTHFH